MNKMIYDVDFKIFPYPISDENKMTANSPTSLRIKQYCYNSVSLSATMDYEGDLSDKTVQLICTLDGYETYIPDGSSEGLSFGLNKITQTAGVWKVSLGIFNTEDMIILAVSNPMDIIVVPSAYDAIATESTNS